MDFYLKKCKQADVEILIQKYIHTLSSPIDSFLEEHIFESVFYTISFRAEAIGYYAIYGNQYLTQFYVERSYCHKSQEVFSKVLSDHAIQSILVPTCDELFLSLALDYDYKIEKQAYLFQDKKVEIPREKLFRDGEFSVADYHDITKITKVCHDFIDKLDERIASREIFTYTNGEILLGIGIIEKSKLQDRYASIGIFTNKLYRKQGIGRTVIYLLKRWCYDSNLVPICGCWYYNVASKQTLESAGMISISRLLNIKVL